MLINFWLENLLLTLLLDSNSHENLSPFYFYEFNMEAFLTWIRYESLTRQLFIFHIFFAFIYLVFCIIFLRVIILIYFSFKVFWGYSLERPRFRWSSTEYLSSSGKVIWRNLNWVQTWIEFDDDVISNKVMQTMCLE